MTHPRNSRSLAAEAAFRARLIELGATLLELEWLGSAKKHHIRCSAGHDAFPRPASVQQGTGVCWECSGRHPGVAETEFRSRVEALGGVVLYSAWSGANRPHHCRCREGHDCFPHPAAVQQGQGICKTCARRDPALAEVTFRRLVEAAGGTPLYGRWQGIKHPHHVQCAAGHACYPRPNDTQQGIGICKTCAGQDSQAAEAAFRARLAELGATPLFGEWIGRKARYRIRCAAGHERNPWADTVMNGSACRICAGLDPATAEAGFRARLADLGALPLYGEWLGVGRGHHVRCASGHDAYPHPTHVQQGGGICAVCSHEMPTVFYVLQHHSAPVVKFGISSAEGRRRLADHRANGYSIVHRLVTDLEEGAAAAAEKAVLATLALAREKPVRGREYFDLSCLALILDVADSWLTAPATSARRWVQDLMFAA